MEGGGGINRAFSGRTVECFIKVSLIRSDMQIWQNQLRKDQTWKEKDLVHQIQITHLTDGKLKTKDKIPKSIQKGERCTIPTLFPHWGPRLFVPSLRTMLPKVWTPTCHSASPKILLEMQILLRRSETKEGPATPVSLSPPGDPEEF